MLKAKMWMTLLFGGTAGLFLLWTVSVLWHLRWVQRLPDVGTSASDSIAELEGSLPRCSIVVAARDEAARLEQTVRRLLAQKGVDLELIVVDDRSTDATPEILRRLEQEDPRVHVRRVDALPEGWLGKCHACYLGASLATGEWILFTDADCWFKPDVIARALRIAKREAADHLTLTSGLAGSSAALRAGHLLFLISLANWFSGVNRDRPKSFIGFGAFNLVRPATYRRSGGYEALRLTVLDDVKLGLLLRRAGGRTRAFLGGDDVECFWGRTAWSTVRLMEKNYFAAFDYRLGLVLAGSAFVIGVFAVLGLGLFSRTFAGLAAVLSPSFLVWPGAILAQRLGWPWWRAMLVPFMLPLFLCAALNSTFKTVRRGGIRWRDTFYSLEALKRGNYQ